MTEPKPTESATDLAEARKAREVAAEEARVKERAVQTSRELRRRRLRRLAAISALFVGLPTLLATIYYGLLASPQYQSEAVVTLVGETSAGSRAARGPSGLDLVRQHMLSRAALADVDREHGLVAHFQDAGADWWSRLADDAGTEKTYDYYRDKVRIAHDADAAALTLRVRAFSPGKAQELAGGLLESTRRFLNQQSEESTRQVIAPADQAVADARARLATLRSATPVPAPGSEAELEQTLAREQLTAALRGMEEARAEAARRQRHLSVVAAPSLPDQATEPRPLWSITTVFVTAAALLGVLWLLLAAVREHSRF